MTYNVWFEGHNDDNRYANIIKMILDSKSNVVCLQECTDKFVKLLANDNDIREKFPSVGI